MKATLNQDWTCELHGDLISLYHQGTLVKAHTVRMNDAVDHFKAYVEKAKAQLEKKKTTKKS